jgi:hypothetical protein
MLTSIEEGIPHSYFSQIILFITPIVPQCPNMKSKLRPLVKDIPLRIIGERISVNGKLSPRSSLPLSQPLPAQIMSRGPPLEILTHLLGGVGMTTLSVMVDDECQSLMEHGAILHAFSLCC